MEQKALSVTELAKILHISRPAALKKIKTGEIKAQKVGRSFVVQKAELTKHRVGNLTEEKKELIKDSIRKIIKDYEGAVSVLGNE